MILCLHNLRGRQNAATPVTKQEGFSVVSSPTVAMVSKCTCRLVVAYAVSSFKCCFICSFEYMQVGEGGEKINV